MKASWIKFADHYLNSGNATRAYMAAYPKCLNEASAWPLASKLLRNDKVAAYIKEKQEEIAKKEIIKKEQILMDLKIIVNNNIYERPAIAIKAYELAVKMLGYNAPIESMVTINREQPLFNDNQIPNKDEDNK
jgi:hypothetical protein